METCCRTRHFQQKPSRSFNAEFHDQILPNQLASYHKFRGIFFASSCSKAMLRTRNFCRPIVQPFCPFVTFDCSTHIIQNPSQVGRASTSIFSRQDSPPLRISPFIRVLLSNTSSVAASSREFNLSAIYLQMLPPHSRIFHLTT